MTAPAHAPVQVRSEVRNGVGIISFARPERLNALTFWSAAQLRSAFVAMGERTDVGAVILRGDGRAFCAGLDVGEGIADPSVPDPIEAVSSGLRHGSEAVWAMRAIPQPVIAVVHGHAVGAGFAFAAAADIRFIGQAARFSAPFVKLGMTVGDLGLSWFLPRIIGHGRASELFYGAGALSADEAVSYGLASRVSEDPLAEAVAFAEAVAAWSPYAVSTSKRLIDASASASLRDHLEAESRAQVIGLHTRRAQSEMTALLAGDDRKE